MKPLRQTPRLLQAFLLLSALATNSVLAAHDHSPWDTLLGQYVLEVNEGRATQVDYAGFKRDEEALNRYLAGLSAVPRDEFDAWTRDEQLAFLINAYNAFTVALVASEYPDIDSIKDIGGLFRSPWKREFIPLFGTRVSLDNIEHDMIRGWDRFQEPRIHFAVNCAAIGCPALRGEAYQGNILEQQLDQGTRAFLSDRSRNYVDGNRLWVSSIFDWYEEDFERGWGGVDSLEQFLSRYPDELGMDAEQVQRLLAGELRIRNLRYDWDLNAIP